MLDKTKTHRCEFPGCTITSDDVTEMHKHHIISRAQGGHDGESNLILLCPNCHTNIHNPSVSSGVHKNIGKKSIIILSMQYGITNGNYRYLLEYQRCIDNEICLSNLGTWRGSSADKLIERNIQNGNYEY